MLNAITELNWLAIILATSAYFILGGLWFAPFAFRKLWDRAIGFSRPEEWKPSAKFFAGPLIGCFTASIATSMLISALNIDSYIEAVILGLIVGIGYAGSVSFVNAITPTNPHPFLLGAVTGIYHLLGVILVAIIIVALG